MANGGIKMGSVLSEEAVENAGLWSTYIALVVKWGLPRARGRLHS